MANKMAIDSLVNRVSNDDQSSEVPLPPTLTETIATTSTYGKEDINVTDGQEILVPEVQKSTSKSGSRKTKNSSKLTLPPEVADEMIPTVLDKVILDDGEHVVPLGVPPSVQGHYCDIIEDNAQAQMDLMINLKPPRKTIAAMEKMISELDSLMAHPDLLDRTANITEENDHNEEEFNHSRMISWKFGFLDLLLLGIWNGTGEGLPQGLKERTKDADTISVAVVVREGKLLEILTRFLVQTNLPFTTLHDGKIFNEQIKSNLRLLVVPSNLSPNDEMSAIDLIYVMDSSFLRHSDLAKALKGTEDRKAHVIYPWVWGSPEHVRACIPPVQTYVDQLRVFTQILTQTRGQLGNKEKTFQQKATSVTKWVLDGFRQTFPEELGEGIILTDLKLTFTPTKKRSLDVSDEEQPVLLSKRRRTEEALMEDIPANLVAPMDEISALRKRNADIMEECLSRGKLIDDYSTALRDLKDELDVAKEEIQETRLGKEQLLNEFVVSQQTAVGLMNACDNALIQKENAQKRVKIMTREKERAESALKETTALYESRIAKLEAELHEARAIQTSTNEASTTPSNSAAFLQLQSENALLKKKVQSSDRDRSYAMQLYQDASSKAVESAQEVIALQAERDQLAQLAEGQSHRVLQDIDHSELEATKVALDKTLAEKEEVEEQLRRGNGRIGVSTRGQSSAPASSRSPRVVTSPPRSRATSRQPASRANSPTRVTPGSRRGQAGKLGDH